ncbi:DUF1993 family protein [Shimwellia blattae]|uniref:DUF1993 domain-containing protein n=1 Tax=Shimwellia blattae (strain ATCC 29907 / DSM 4481 / JCM 1650 / NBRC 105725 / CDC 9005-74) TaxID=630626 RepID=I2B8C8_SHIBC|nr:DUF1993 domain-containing protein [Shimwellia blattae]AFJ46782.1 hypothetical protein EBL_c16880 [Shimwellia blattae DSM 4481 = NBRC 105725]GAB82091.1 hypothetical protein EB105725_19_00840 [Shimwellia blattae DSM 4481 = NBRC 105725]VDY64261.1 Uncharacterized protein conserved in bacteria [Shimwellia blattae]VEC22386.1 Uncharacterized protein conserved in bacteria [Shimwellia blattae]
MSQQLYVDTAGQLVNGLKSLSAILEKAEAWAGEKGVEPQVLLQTRLVADMFPLVRQIQMTSDISKGAVARLAGVEAPVMADDETSFGELRQRLDNTIAFITGISPGQYTTDDEMPVVIKARSRELHFTAKHYLYRFVVPNFYFHMTTAYDILRQQGVPIGKQDFLGAL